MAVSTHATAPAGYSTGTGTGNFVLRVPSLVIQRSFGTVPPSRQRKKKVNVDSEGRAWVQTIVGISSQSPSPLAHRCRRCQLPFFADFYRFNH